MRRSTDASRHLLARTLHGVGAAAAAVVLAAAPWHAAHAQPWNELSASEQQVLEPLRNQWGSIDPARQAKWREVAGRYRSLSPEEQQRLRGRMVDWDRMSAEQRTEARARFKESNQVPASERQARWEAYKSLPPEQREELAARAARRPGPFESAATLPPSAATLAPASPFATSPAARRGFATREPVETLRPVSPGMVQAGPGASTRPLLKPPVPPRHQQPGLPRIAATPEFVNPSTLQPQRGPQGAAAQPAAKPRKDDRRDAKRQRQ